MVMVLEQQMINHIAAIGRQRYPNEACGVMLPLPINGVQVVELPNRSKAPVDSFEMVGEDVVLELERVFRGNLDQLEEMLTDLTAWHTHPRGHVGPSTYDLKNRTEVMKNLVVTLFSDGQPPLATWF